MLERDWRYVCLTTNYSDFFTSWVTLGVLCSLKIDGRSRGNCFPLFGRNWINFCLSVLMKWKLLVLLFCDMADFFCRFLFFKFCFLGGQNVFDFFWFLVLQEYEKTEFFWNFGWFILKIFFLGRKVWKLTQSL